MKGKICPPPPPLLHIPFLVTNVQTCLGPHCSYIKNKWPTVKTLAGCTDVTASQELCHLQMPYVNWPDFSKHSVFVYSHHSDHERTCQLNSNLRICSRNTSESTRQIWWWISSDNRGADSFGSLLFAQLFFSRIPNASCVADLDILRHIYSFLVYHDMETILALSE